MVKHTTKRKNEQKAAAAMWALDQASSQVDNRKEEIFKIDLTDQANLDLAFVEAFVDLLFTISGDGQNLDAVKSKSVCALAYEATFKLDSLKKFIAKIPVGSIIIPSRERKTARS